MNFRFLLLLAFLALPLGADAQNSTANQVIDGYMASSGCPSGLSVCWLQYGATIPVSGTLTPGTPTAIAPVVGGSAASSLVLKASAGSLNDVYATCTAACWLMVFNQTTAPSNGSTTAGIAATNMQDCIPIGASGVGGLTYAGGAPETFTTGITAVISSTACATLTLATTGFIHGRIN